MVRGSEFVVGSESGLGSEFLVGMVEVMELVNVGVRQLEMVGGLISEKVEVERVICEERVWKFDLFSSLPSLVSEERRQPVGWVGFVSVPKGLNEYTLE